MGKQYEKPKQFTYWSFSAWNDWMTCPYMAKLKRLEKLKTTQMVKKAIGIADGSIEPGPMERGDMIAKKTDKYLSGRSKTIPVELAPLATLYREIKKKEPAVEQNWGFTRDWKPCSTTDWSACWLRVKIDVQWIEEGKSFDILHIRDNKTGKMRDYKNEEYMMQLDLYGCAGLTLLPTVDKVTTQLLYSDMGTVYPDKPQIFTRDELNALQKRWEKRVKPMLVDTRFAPRPGRQCHYCDFAKKNGGPCRY